MAGVRLELKEVTQTVNFDVNVKLEEKERKSQMVAVNFELLLTTKPNVVKFEVDGTAILRGKDEEVRKMLEVNPETKVPDLFQKVYQSAFAAMYLMSTILNSPSPPHDLLYSGRKGPVEGVSVEVGEEADESTQVTAVPSNVMNEEKTESRVI